MHLRSGRNQKEWSGGDKSKYVKTQVRFDNLKEDLVLGVREGKDEPWKFYPPTKLPKVELDLDDDTDSRDGVSVVDE